VWITKVPVFKTAPSNFETILSHLLKPAVIIWTASVVEWSEFLATDPEARVRFPSLPKKLMVLERGPLSLVITTEEQLDRKVAVPV
jgi:hypothetical protein